MTAALSLVDRCSDTVRLAVSNRFMYASELIMYNNYNYNYYNYFNYYNYYTVLFCTATRYILTVIQLEVVN